MTHPRTETERASEREKEGERERKRARAQDRGAWGREREGGKYAERGGQKDI